MNTTQNLPSILTARNSRRYARLIERALAGQYHDTMSDSKTPKLDLKQDISRFPELADVLEDVRAGRFNESDGSYLFTDMWSLLTNLRYVSNASCHASY